MKSVDTLVVSTYAQVAVAMDTVMSSLLLLQLQNIDLSLIEGLGAIPQGLTILAAHGGLNAMRVRTDTVLMVHSHTALPRNTYTAFEHMLYTCTSS